MEPGPLDFVAFPDGREGDATIPLLVGEGNPYSDDPRNALLPWPREASGNRLRTIMQLTDVEYMRLARCNLCLGTRFTLKEARERVADLVMFWRGGPLVLCGAKVARAFGVDPAPFVARDSPAFRKLYVIPHPSGLSRAWNEPGAYDRCRALLTPVLAWARGEVVA